MSCSEGEERFLKGDGSFYCLSAVVQIVVPVCRSVTGRSIRNTTFYMLPLMEITLCWGHGKGKTHLQIRAV